MFFIKHLCLFVFFTKKSYILKRFNKCLTKIIKVMNNEDLIQVSYTEEELNLANESLNQLEAIANKYRPNLSAEERVSYGTIKEVNKLFVNKSKTLMEQNSNLIPPFLDMDEFNRDFKARTITKIVWLFTEALDIGQKKNKRELLLFTIN